MSVSGQTNLNGHVNIGNSTADIVTINSAVDSNLNPDATGNNRDLGNAVQKWKDLHLSGTLYATAISGVTSISANVTGNLTGKADSATQLYVTDTATNADFRVLFATAGGTGANRDAHTDANSFYFNPSTNTLGVANILTANVGNGATIFDGNLTGTANNADYINIDETNANTQYQVTFSAYNNAGYNRQYIDSDNGQFNWNPATATLSGLNISGSSIQGTTFGTATQNAYGTRTVSQGNPSGGSDGDIWYKY